MSDLVGVKQSSLVEFAALTTSHVVIKVVPSMNLALLYSRKANSADDLADENV